MSLTGRYIIDRMKRALPRFRLPVPPYHQPSYWEGVYRQLGPADSFEWGRITSRDLFQYEYTPYSWNDDNDNSHESMLLKSLMQKNSSKSSNRDPSARCSTTLAETLQVNAGAAPTIVMLGCGNSELGPDMARSNNWISSRSSSQQRLIMVDVSARVVESMSLRHADLVSSGDLQFVQDDATVLSAFSNHQVGAVMDKGLVDAIFCADDYDSCWNILTSVHRVLQPGGTFVCLSFSRPEFLLNRLLLPSDTISKKQKSQSSANANMLDSQKRLQWFGKAWDDVQVRQLDRILLYRFQKAKEDKITTRKSRQR